MNYKFIIVFGVMCLTMLGVKWTYDSSIKRKMAEIDCYTKASDIADKISFKDYRMFALLCREMWGDKYLSEAIKKNTNDSIEKDQEN